MPSPGNVNGNSNGNGTANVLLEVGLWLFHLHSVFYCLIGLSCFLLCFSKTSRTQGQGARRATTRGAFESGRAGTRMAAALESSASSTFEPLLAWRILTGLTFAAVDTGHPVAPGRQMNDWPH